MEEKRRSKRIVLDVHIIMKRVDPGKSERLPVDVIDVSRSGIGFSCNQLLEMGSIYEAEIQIWTKEIIKTFVNIVRMDQKDDRIVYGATFVGLNDTDANKIMIYDMFEESRKSNNG
ncbi:MAG: PilZ domain-containing protein [Lachnospiraceae bacterium]|nr:PilZ domain-containing protein [Lachnospiraceae bacterium]